MRGIDEKDQHYLPPQFSLVLSSQVCNVVYWQILLQKSVEGFREQ